MEVGATAAGRLAGRGCRRRRCRLGARGLLERQVPACASRHLATGDRRDAGVPKQPAVGGDVCVDAADLVAIAGGDHRAANLKGALELRPDLVGPAGKQRHIRG